MIGITPPLPSHPFDPLTLAQGRPLTSHVSRPTLAALASVVLLPLLKLHFSRTATDQAGK